MKKVLNRLWQQQDGAIAIIFALSLIPVVLTVGLAIDGSRAYYTQQKISASLDAAALASARALQMEDLSDDQVDALAKTYLKVHMQPDVGNGIKLDTIDVTVERDKKTVTIATTGSVVSYFGGIIGINTMSIEREARAVFSFNEVELGLMLDVSGSMDDYGKIGDLRAAVGDLIDILIPELKPDNGVKIAFAPYSTAVNAGALADKAKGKGQPPKNKREKCVTERTGSAAFKDDAPKNGKVMGDKASDCPNNEIVPLSKDREVLNTALQNLTPDGSTAGHLGAAWAWYLISPEWAELLPAESQPKPYTDRNTIKGVVLMTDGMFNTSYESSNGDLPAQFLELCNNMKNRGLRVYAVSFQAPAGALATLRSCASTPADFFDAANGQELRAYFRDIADRLTKLRLSN